MLEKGLDPELVKPMIKEFLQQDPAYIAAMEYKKEKGMPILQPEYEGKKEIELQRKK